MNDIVTAVFNAVIVGLLIYIVVEVAPVLYDEWKNRKE